MTSYERQLRALLTDAIRTKAEDFNKQSQYALDPSHDLRKDGGSR